MNRKENLSILVHTTDATINQKNGDGVAGVCCQQCGGCYNDKELKGNDMPQLRLGPAVVPL